MTEDDFYNYYIIPCGSLSIADDWEVHCVFPAEDSFIEHEAEALGISHYETQPISPDFRKNLEELFQKNGVGFEKEDVYPPYLEQDI